MAKTLEEKREERVREIMELTKDREKINAKLNFLTGLVETPSGAFTKASLPIGFPMKKEVEELYKEHKELRILQATALLQKKHSQYEVARAKVHAAIAYLAQTGFLKKEPERGLFSLKEKEELEVGT